VPKFALLAAPFLHGGIVPLVVGCLFLFVLGDNVEDRLGRVPFLLFFLICGAVAGAAHVLWGTAGMPAALGSAGAVAGVLGAYLVFFPDVPIAMYGMGRVVTVPAYLFACAWAVAVFLWGWGPGPLSNLLNPAPYSLAGHLAGFAAGVAGAALWGSLENGGSGKPATGLRVKREKKRRGALPASGETVPWSSKRRSAADLLHLLAAAAHDYCSNVGDEQAGWCCPH
jgi:membrane associated rhomboid family serine protease